MYIVFGCVWVGVYVHIPIWNLNFALILFSPFL